VTVPPFVWRPCLAVLVLLLTGCATFRNYDEEMRQPLSLASEGNVDAAIGVLNRHNRAKKKDMLYYMELGELRRLGEQYVASNSAWASADRGVREWESAAKLDPARTAGALMSYAVNDKVRPYEGHDYEKVMLTTRIALNYLAEGDWDNARVAIKQTHEREAVIAQVHEKQTQQLEQQARKSGARTSVRELNGYPVETIDNPAVNALRNSYQSAFSHYLAGFVYEALGEPSLAAAGYRQAIELQPGLPLLEDALAGLDTRVAARDEGTTDLLIAVETGLVPARVSQQFPLPIPVNDRLILIPVSFPILQDTEPGRPPDSVRIDGIETHAVPITSVDAMVRRALQDEMPAIMLRSFVRSTGKAVAQYQTQRQADINRRRGNGGAAAALDIATIALMLGSVVTESADERGWRSLPATISIARVKLPPGAHRISLSTWRGDASTEIELRGRYAFVGLRLLGDALYSFGRRPHAPLPAEAKRMHAMNERN